MQNCLMRLQESSFVHKIDCCDCGNTSFVHKRDCHDCWTSFWDRKDCHDCWNEFLTQVRLLWLLERVLRSKRWCRDCSSSSLSSMKIVKIFKKSFKLTSPFSWNLKRVLQTRNIRHDWEKCQVSKVFTMYQFSGDLR